MNGKDTQSWYLRGLDRLKLFDIEKENHGMRADKIRLKYEEKKIYLGYHSDYKIAKALYYCRNMEKVIWDFSIDTSKKLKYQVFIVLNYVLEHSEDCELRDEYLAPLNFFYQYCIEKEIFDLTALEQEQIVNEVCMIKREDYYLKEEAAWLRIYQHKMKMEKVIPVPMMLYRIMMVYIERKKIFPGTYVFQNVNGGLYSTTHYWHQMVKWCNDLGIRCGDHVFQTHENHRSNAESLFQSLLSCRIKLGLEGCQEADSLKRLPYRKKIPDGK